MEDMFSGDQTGDSSDDRRLPVYLLLDTSGSMNMHGKIAAVQQGVELFRQLLHEVPEAVQTVSVKVITFDSAVAVPTPFTPITQFQPPHLSASGQTLLGAALRRLNEDAQYGRDLRANNGEQKGDYIPIVFIFSDGGPTDPQAEYDAAAAAILRRVRHQELNVFALAFGPEAATPQVTSKLHQITDTVLQMVGLSNDDIKQMFDWVSQSVITRSRAVSTPSAGANPPPTIMPPLSPGLVIV